MILFANVQSMDNKMDELQARISTQRYVQDCSMLCETWLNGEIPDEPLTPGGYTIFRADRDTERSGNTRGGGTAILVKQSWCTDCKVISRFCSEDVEYLTLRCGPYFLPRELQCIIVTVVYIPPSAKEEAALDNLHNMISKHENRYLDSAVIVLGNFNHCNLQKNLPKYHQYVTFPTTDKNTLDQCYSNLRKSIFS